MSYTIVSWNVIQDCADRARPVIIFKSDIPFLNYSLLRDNKIKIKVEGADPYNKNFTAVVDELQRLNNKSCANSFYGMLILETKWLSYPKETGKFTLL
tara:strand:+ start:279 stop:572 length:294 start_codon:yes stop_codon:yes gene_type:complete